MSDIQRTVMHQKELEYRALNETNNDPARKPAETRKGGEYNSTDNSTWVVNRVTARSRMQAATKFRIYVAANVTRPSFVVRVSSVL